MNIPNKIDLYVGKTTTNLNEKILEKIESKFEENGLKNFEFHTSRQYGNFPAFVAIQAVADAKAYEIDKANQDLTTYLELKKIEIESEKIKKWDGVFPVYFLGSNPGNLLMSLSAPDNLEEKKEKPKIVQPKVEAPKVEEVVPAGKSTL